MNLSQKLKAPLYATITAISMFLPQSETYAQKPSTINNQESKESKSLEDKVIRIIAAPLFKSTLSSLNIVGIQGGYTLSKPKSYLKSDNLTIPVYYDRGKFLMPKLSDIEKQISSYIDKNTMNLLDKGKTRFNKKNTKLKTTTNIKKGVITLSYEITYKDDTNDNINESFQMKTPNLPIESKLFGMYEIAKFVTDSHKENPDLISISTLADMADERNLIVRSYDPGIKNHTLYKISLRESRSQSSIRIAMSLSREKDPLKRLIKEDKPKVKKYISPFSFFFVNRYSGKFTPESAPAPKAPSQGPFDKDGNPIQPLSPKPKQ